jgi:Domain of unknown function (DUF4328)
LSYAPPGPPQTPLLSADGRWYWDGAQWRPVDAPVAGWPAWARPYASAGARATFVLVSFGIFVGILALWAVVDLVAIALFAAAGGSLTSDEQDLVDILTALVGVFYLINLVVNAVAFLMWIHRAYRNLPSIGYQHARYSPRWAVGGWFVPFLNLVRPYQIVREIWQASLPGVAWQLIQLWWGLWLAGNVVGNLAGRSNFGHGIDQAVDLVANLLFVAGAILGILIVRRVTAAQDARARQVT